MAKGAWAAAGPAGGLLALLTGAFVSRKAIATDHTKSPREQKFVSRFAWIQLGAGAASITLLVIAARKMRALSSPFVRDVWLAAGIYLVWTVGIGLWRYRYLRMMLIQKEDETFNPAQWGHRPQAAGGATNPSGPALSFSLLLRRSALALAFAAIMAFRAP